LVLLGGRSWDAATISAWRQAAEAAALPVACAFRYQDLYPNDASNYIGDVGIGINPKLAERLRAADVLIAIGPLLGEMTTSGYTLIEHPRPVQQLVHVHAGAESLGRVYQAARLVNCQPARFARALAARIERDRLPSGRWAADTAASRAAYETWQRPRAQPGGVNMGEVILALRARLRDDAIVCNGAGNFATPVHRFFRYRRWPTQLAPTSGAMGYGIPAGVAAKLQFPERQVVVVAGDGDFMMTAQELATAAQYRAGIVVLIVNNGMYGTIRMHQEREFPERVFGTELANPDFVLMGQAYGMHAERVTQTASFDAALERALASARGALIELVIDPQAITPGATIDEIRAQARQRRVR
jgi:acetolactate synthase-1/2/3 large subunit